MRKCRISRIIIQAISFYFFIAVNNPVTVLILREVLLLIYSTPLQSPTFIFG